MNDKAKRLGAAAAIATAIAIPAEGLRQLVLSAPLSTLNKLSGKFISFWRFVLGTNGSFCSIFKRPSARCYAVVHDANRYSVSFGNLSPRQFIVSHVDDGSVSGLGFSCGPCAVIRAVAKRVVFAFYRQIGLVSGLFRPLQERLKTMPVLANGYSFSAIVFIRSISTSRKHIAPASMYFCAFHTMRCGSASNRSSRPLASTRNALAISKVSANYSAHCSARTFAKPQSGTASFVSGLFNNNPLPKFKPRHVNQPWVTHGVSPMVSS